MRSYKALYENEKDRSGLLTAEAKSLHSQNETLRQFVLNYLWSAHADCRPTDEAVCLTPDQLHEAAGRCRAMAPSSNQADTNCVANAETAIARPVGAGKKDERA